MSDLDSKNDQLATAELIAAQTQELVETVREDQRELNARIAETSELIDRTKRVLEESESVERLLGDRPEDS
jgi:hypothetical protein